jgi:hypothetical protein
VWDAKIPYPVPSGHFRSNPLDLFFRVIVKLFPTFLSPKNILFHRGTSPISTGGTWSPKIVEIRAVRAILHQIAQVFFVYTLKNIPDISVS